MYVLLEFWQKIMAIPIMNPLSWFMIQNTKTIKRNLRNVQKRRVFAQWVTFVQLLMFHWLLHFFENLQSKMGYVPFTKQSKLSRVWSHQLSEILGCLRTIQKLRTTHTHACMHIHTHTQKQSLQKLLLHTVPRL